MLGASRYLHRDEVEIFLVADTTEPVTCAKGIRVLPDRSWDDAGEVDVLLSRVAADAGAARQRAIRSAGSRR